MKALLLPGLLTMAGLVVLISLGLWQLDRLAWKQGLISAVAATHDMPPQPLALPGTWAALDQDALRYRRYKVTGHFLHDRELHFYTGLNTPKGETGGPGYFILTPLKRDDGTFIFINRGFVPEAMKARSARPGDTESHRNRVTVIGRLIAQRKAGPFTLADDHAANVWFTRDSEKMAVATGLTPHLVAPFTLDAEASMTPAGGFPQAGETKLTFSNNHLGYAITWLGLAAALFFTFCAFAWTHIRSRPG